MVYNTGLPGGSPSNADLYQFANLRLPDYRRADLGISYVIIDPNRDITKSRFLRQLKELTIGFQIFNMFDSQNSITNIFVRDAVTRRQFAIPNVLTPRLFNLQLKMRL